MPAGTLTLTNNSAIVKGTGTAFNTELKAGDFIVSVVGGVTYTLPVKAVDSAMQVTLIKAYDGPTQAGAAWYAVPREMQNSITAQLVSEATKAMRGMNYDKENWQQVFSGTGDVTIKLPDGREFTGPAWNSFNTALNLKADKEAVNKKLDKEVTSTQSIKSALNLDGAENQNTLKVGGFAQFVKDAQVDGKFKVLGDLTNTGVARLSSAVYTGDITLKAGTIYQMGTGNNSGGEVRSSTTFAYPYNGGSMRSEIYSVDVVGNRFEYRIVAATGGETAIYTFGSRGNAWAPGTWQNGSDRRIKTDIKKVDNALDKVKKINGYTFKKGSNSDAGVIAQELIEVLPEAVATGGDYTLDDGTVVKDCLGVAYGALSALFIEAIKELSNKITNQDEEINKLKKAMESKI